MLFRSQLEQEAQAIEAAVNRVLAAGCRTRDIAGGGAYLSTTEMGDRVVAALA